MGVGPDPIKIKGLTRPLTLHWDGVGGKFQLMILTALTDVDVVLAWTSSVSLMSRSISRSS